jgi:hypothetical protein
VEQCRDMILRQCQRAARGGDSPFDLGARGVLEHSMHWSGEWARCHGLAAASSKAENHPRGTAAGRLLGRCGFFGLGPFHFGPRPHGACFLGSAAHSFVFYYFSKKGFSPGY